jgi:hypothetical protein
MCLLFGGTHLDNMWGNTFGQTPLGKHIWTPCLSACPVCPYASMTACLPVCLCLPPPPHNHLHPHFRSQARSHLTALLSASPRDFPEATLHIVKTKGNNKGSCVLNSEHLFDHNSGWRAPPEVLCMPLDSHCSLGPHLIVVFVKKNK